GYDVTLTAELSRLPFPDASFDYVVSLDVIGHVGLEEKDEVLGEIKRVLRPGGVTMHGIECTDRRAQKDYDQMSQEELRRFIEVDGHVGLEEEQEHAARFQRFFRHVSWEARYTLCLSSEEIIKQADKYGLIFESDFLDYLRNLSFKERRAFDMAMGYVFGKISDLHIRLPKAGLYVLLKASDAPLGPFYNENRDRRSLFSALPRIAQASTGTPMDNGSASSVVCLDRGGEAKFDDGWYEPNVLPPVARWMGNRGRVWFSAAGLTEITLDLISHIPDLSERPLGLELSLNNTRICAFSLMSNSWTNLRVAVPELFHSSERAEFEFEIRADRTWQPRPDGVEARDDRELSIAVCNIEIVQEGAEVKSR
ncbi:MAG: class I SAM-dependent methyltransferase, partial [Pyrinomonadaceae bacterium]